MEISFKNFSGYVSDCVNSIKTVGDAFDKAPKKDEWQQNIQNQIGMIGATLKGCSLVCSTVLAYEVITIVTSFSGVGLVTSVALACLAVGAHDLYRLGQTFYGIYDPAENLKLNSIFSKVESGLKTVFNQLWNGKDVLSWDTVFKTIIDISEKELYIGPVITFFKN